MTPFFYNRIFFLWMILFAVYPPRVHGFASSNQKSSKPQAKSSGNGNNAVTVNHETIEFNNQLNKMARKFDRHSAQQVESLLRQTVQNVEYGLELDIVPNEVSFTAAISAWARSLQPNSAQKAEDVLNWMLELSQSDENLSLNIRPNCYAFNAAIRAWVRNTHKSQIPDAHNHAERLMDQLWELYHASEGPDEALKPNAITFNLVINAIARSRESGCADRAASLLNRMEELYTAGDEDMKPDAQTFGAIINAYANAEDDDSIEQKEDCSDKAAQILQNMESLYQLGYESVKPNTFVYNACLNAFAKSSGRDNRRHGESHESEGDEEVNVRRIRNVEKARMLLEVMEKNFEATKDLTVKPDVITYSTCINVYANSRLIDAGIEADKLLRRMTQLYLVEGDDGVKPNGVTYTACIKAWMAAAEHNASDKNPASGAKDQPDDQNEVISSMSIRQRTAERAEELVQVMALQYLAGDPKLKPTRGAMDLAKEAMENINDSEGKQRIEKLQKRIFGKKRAPRREPV